MCRFPLTSMAIMALVDYASSDDEDGTIPVPLEDIAHQHKANLDLKAVSSHKRKHEEQLPPLPAQFHDLYASTTRVSTKDDPSLHGGRKRATPHIQGNWPTHLYIEWFPSNSEQELLTNLISALQTSSSSSSESHHSFLTSELGTPLPLHISLSRPIGFATEQKDDFVAALERAIGRSGIRPFEVAFSSLDWVSNFEKNRWFLVLRVKMPDSNGLNKLLHVSNTVVQEYGQPPLYVEPTPKPTPPQKRPRFGTQVNSKNDWSQMQDRSGAFHFSIAWTLEPPDKDLIGITKALATSQMEEVSKIKVHVEDIKAKVGNVVQNIHLLSKVGESKGIFGF